MWRTLQLIGCDAFSAAFMVQGDYPRIPPPWRTPSIPNTPQLPGLESVVRLKGLLAFLDYYSTRILCPLLGASWQSTLPSFCPRYYHSCFVPSHGTCIAQVTKYWTFLLVAMQASSPLNSLLQICCSGTWAFPIVSDINLKGRYPVDVFHC